MSFQIVIKFLYKDGTNYTMVVRVPKEVADQISIFNLMATQVYCEPVHGAADSVPSIEDFVKNNNLEGFEIKKGLKGEIG